MLVAVLRQMWPLTFGNWPLPYKEKIIWHVYILPGMTSYVYSDMRSYLHVYITCTSREHRMYMNAPAKTRPRVMTRLNLLDMRAKYSIFTLSLQVQNERAPGKNRGFYNLGFHPLSRHVRTSWTVSKQTLHRGEGIKWAVSPNRCHFEAVLA